MARDIEEFLRRAAERRQQQKQGGAVPIPPPQPTPPTLTPAASSPILEKTPRNQFRQFPTKESIVVNAEIVEDQRLVKKNPGKRESISEQVEKYLDTSEIKKKVQNLGGQVAKVSQEFDWNVKQHLNKDICSVEDDRSSTEIKKQKNDNTAAKLKRMLARPETIRQAILISEVLNRPSFNDD